MTRASLTDDRRGRTTASDRRQKALSIQARRFFARFQKAGKGGEERSLGDTRLSRSLSLSVAPREKAARSTSRATSRQNRADDVVEHEGGFCRRTHVTSDSFSTPASRRRAFIPTSRGTPPFASLERHPARAGIGPRVVTTWWESALPTRGFYGNGGGVARDNLVIGIPGAGWQARRTTEDLSPISAEERRRRARNKRSPAGLPPTVPREITRRTPP